MNIVSEIRKSFANLTEGQFLEIKLSGGCVAWAYKMQGSYGIAVDMPDDKKVSERFATAKMFTMSQNLTDNVLHNFLAFENTEYDLRNEFAAVCAQFVDPGEHGGLRAELCGDPSAWWSRWKQLLGNSVSEKTTHGVLGELLIYLKLLEDKLKPVWHGPSNKSHDVETDRIDYEIKSTLARYGTSVTISGQHQLETAANKELKLLFCRFEKTANTGFSINDVVKAIIECGVDKSVLEKQLNGLGFEDGSSARHEKYVLHDRIRLYPVDDNFPKITGASFVGGQIPDNVIQLTYQLELTSLKSSIFEGPSSIYKT